MSSIPMHASCHGNRSGEAFLKDPVKHLECARLGERERYVVDTSTLCVSFLRFKVEMIWVNLHRWFYLYKFSGYETVHL